MDENQFQMIVDRLDCLIALACRKDLAEKNKTESILLLNSLGISKEVISRVTGASKNAIDARVSEKRRKSK